MARVTVVKHSAQVGRGTPMRTMRISDQVWSNAHRIAELNATTVTAIVVGYLDSLHVRSKLRPTQLRKGVSPVERNNPRRPRVDGPRNLKDARFAPITTPAIKPEDCDHRGAHVLSIGTFCSTCRTRIA